MLASSDSVVSTIEQSFSAGVTIYFHKYYSKMFDALLQID